MSTSTALKSTVLSRRDIDFMLHEWLKVENLCTRERYSAHSREIFDDVIDLADTIATERFETHNRKADTNEPYIGDDGTVVLIPEIGAALRAHADAGFIGATLDEAVGGMQLPQVIGSAALAFFQAANVATCTYPILTSAAANLLLTHGSREQHEQWVVPMVEGRYFGTMCLSETQAGSSLADITTRATPQEDGSYLFTGSKMWTSAGDHELSENIVHLVLAKIPGGPPGVKGISLFIVPQLPAGRLSDNNVVLVGLNHKMGFRGTTNTVLTFESARGWLVGRTEQWPVLHVPHDERSQGRASACARCRSDTPAICISCGYARERLQGRCRAPRTRRGRRSRSSSTPISAACCWLRRPMSRGHWRSVCTAARLVDDERIVARRRMPGATRTCCSTS